MSKKNKEQSQRVDNARATILVIAAQIRAEEKLLALLAPSYNVLEASDGQEGIQKAKEIIPDLIFANTRLPDIDGYNLCRILKDNLNTCHIPIVFFAAKGSTEQTVEAFESGADEYFQLPFNEKILIARIKNLIDLRRL